MTDAVSAVPVERFAPIARALHLGGLAVEGDTAWFSDVVGGGVHRVEDDGTVSRWLPDRRYVGGLILNLITGHGFDIDITGLVGSTIGAIVVLLIYGPIRDRTRPAPPATTNTAIKPKNKNR